MQIWLIYRVRHIFLHYDSSLRESPNSASPNSIPDFDSRIFRLSNEVSSVSKIHLKSSQKSLKVKLVTRLMATSKNQWQISGNNLIVFWLASATAQIFNKNHFSSRRTELYLLWVLGVLNPILHLCASY